MNLDLSTMKKLFLLLFIFSFHLAGAQLRLPSLFGDHMVFQQQSDAPIWGWASPGEKIFIKPSWSPDTVKTQAANTGKWMAKVKTPAAGGPFQVWIKARDIVTLNDVMIGEVWICSGQSNMEWSVNNGSADAKEDMPKANFPGIRLFHVNRSGAALPQEHGEGEWKLCTPESMKGFSAVGYFFGKKLNADLKIPIGLINVSWGGTPAEVWLPKEKVESDSDLKASASLLKEFQWWPKDPGVVYNSMIKPLVPFSIAGTIWYQGESNAASPSTYSKLMKTLIESWRSDFNKDFPFYFVQIAPYSGYGRMNEAALVQEQQCKVLKMVPKTGMVIISDKVDNLADIHPTNKKPVGDRLANLALTEMYGHPVSGYRSPVYKSVAVEKGKARISFDYAEVGLISFGGDPKEFQIAGSDKKFYPAIAKIEGSTVIVSAKEVKVPVAVRYAWGNAIVSNLYNKEGLPVSIFRTDDWEVELSPVVKK